MIARDTDPATSHQAASEFAQDGTRSNMMEVAYELIKSNPGKTAAELEQLSGLGDGKVRKRLNDLRHDHRAQTGEPRKCSVTGKKAQTWYTAAVVAA